MRMKSIRWIVAVLATVAMLSSARPVAAADDELSPRKVMQAIRRGRAFLISRQNADGSWSAFSPNHTTGVTGLAVLALINSGMTPKDTAVRKGLTFLRREPLPSRTYNASLMLMALAAAKDLGDKNRIIKLAARLEAGQIKQGRNVGSWTYSLTGRNIGIGDRSNAQFAILALRDAVHAGVKVKRETWLRARQHWVNQQNGDGSWSYTGRRGSGTGSMTVAGIATMAITKRMLADKNQIDAQGRPICCANVAPDQPLADAIEWLGKQFNRRNTVVHNANNPRSHLFYYMYGLERAGRLSGRRFFGSNHDWYREGVEYFVIKRANLRDGSWTSPALGENKPVIGTSMVLLFLSKGLAPVLVNKLKYGPQDRRHPDEILGENWNLHPYDVRNLTEFVTQQEKWPKLLSWQTVEMQKLVNYGGDEEALDQAKVLLITGSEDPAVLREESQARILKNYIRRGGFIFVVGNCETNSEFDKGFRQLVKVMFPKKEAELKRLPKDHAVFRSEFRLANNDAEYEDLNLYGVDYGCRTAIIYAPVRSGGRDLSCLWAKWSIQDLAGREVRRGQLGRLDSMIDKSMEIGINVIAYATGREPPEKLQKFGPKTDKGRNDKLTRGFLQVAKLKHNGDWNVAPRALRELLMGLNVANGMTATTKSRSLFANDKNLFKYPIVYMHGRRSFSLSEPEKKQLKTYLTERDCVLFADACCGSKEFDASFRALMRDLFEKDNLKFKRIPLTNKLFSRDVGFNIKKVKRIALESANKNAVIRRTEREVEPFLEGIEIDGRFVVVYSKYDISCALEQQSSIACSGYVRQDAMKIAINVLMYAMAQDVRFSDKLK